MANAKFSAAFFAAVSNSMFNGSQWMPTGEKYSLKDIWAETNPGLYDQIDGDEATVTATEFQDGSTSLRIEVPFKDGSAIQLKLSGKSELEEDDKVKISSIYGQELKKAGSDPIVRYDGVKVA